MTTVPAPSPLAGKPLLPAKYGTRRAFSSWDWMALAIAAFVILPVVVLLGVAFTGEASNSIILLAQTTLLSSLLDTLLLVLGVLALALLTGAAAGWVVATYDFPGRRWISWALVLPIAIPTYIAAYSYVEAFDFFGPLQTLLRTLIGYRLKSEYWFPDMRSQTGAVIVTALVLYPYVYVASRAAFATQGAHLTDAARTLGVTRTKAFRTVILPVIWPMLAAGGTLVVLETLNDIGASQYLGVQTLTVSVFNTWLNRNDLAGASQLALALLLIVVAVLWTERAIRNNKRYAVPARGSRPHQRVKLSGYRGALASCLLLLPVVAGFALPVFVLGQAALRQFRSEGIEAALLKALGNTVLVSTLATGVILMLSVVLAIAQRFTRSGIIMMANRIGGIGYAVPGTVLVIGLLPLLGSIDSGLNWLAVAAGMAKPGLLLSGTVLAIVMAYAIRFLAIGLDQAQAGLGALSRNTDYAARTLGCKESRIAAHILTPAMRPALVGSGILVFVDCLKELPATLLLRPLNFETLATTLYGHASRGSFEDGAMAAFMIVMAGLIPLVFMNRLMEKPATVSGA
ncbi:MAG: ABC transporter permease [Beijerinckiaceae bacterium]